SQNIVEGHGRFREDPFGFIREVKSYLLSQSFRAYDNYIGKELFYPGFSDKIQAETLASPLVQEKIKTLVKNRISEEFKDLSDDGVKQHELEIESWLVDITKNIIKGLATNFENKSTLKFAAFFTSQVLARTYHQGVFVDKNEVQRLLTKAKELESKNQSLIFLPCHKSHIDYIVIHLLCFRLGLSIPSVVAGDNLNFAFIGPALKEIGAMFIKRAINKNDPLYPIVLQSYINTILSKGYNMECFIEGGRSRTGKLLTPKFGILKYILESVLTGSSDDVWIVPVSTQYDRVVENESYINELLGQEKKKESFGDFLSARKILSLKMGRVDVRFHDPWSLKEFVIDSINKEYNLSLNTPVNVVALKTLITPNYHQYMLRSLGYKVLNDINHVSVIMPTALVGTILLTIRHRGVTYNELLRRVEWLIGQIKSSGGQVGIIGDYDNICNSGSHISLPSVIDNALQVLGTNLVHKETKGVVVPIYEPIDRFQLSYYRNMVIHLFVPEGILCVSIVGLIVDDGDCGHNVMPLNKRIMESDLIKQVKFLSKLLSNEFIYEPEGININFTRTLENLKSQSIIGTCTEAGDKQIWISSNEVEHRLQNLDFYCYLIWPFVEGFWLCGLSLFLFLPYYSISSNDGKPETNWIEESAFIKQIQVIGKTLYHMGYLKYYESINKEILKNTLNHYIKQEVLVKLR
ncbi:acyltransferase-domain-containing protein, partial [Nadsonia fulvescens var. elongata DSM 6958]